VATRGSSGASSPPSRRGASTTRRTGWHIHFHAAGEHSRVSGWAAGCATGLAIVLGGEHFDRLGVCTAPHRDRVYVDTSRNGSKRFCSTACQNRVKTAAFREARREPAR
jgi:predicted RNA-binding Zn ribbon-like protein